MSAVHVAAFYQFVAFPDFEEWQSPLREFCAANEIHGTILLAPEGLNATIAGSESNLKAVLDFLGEDERFRELEIKWSRTECAPFARLKIRLKEEIVRMGVPAVDPTKLVGTYVAPKDWNALIEDPDVIVVDTRNDYEVAIGSFRGARNPGLASFREFPKWLESELIARDHPKVAMFCTGGIRCEKSTAFLKQAGVEDVFHLKGGILKYLESVPEKDSLWEGECYVFDERVSVKHGLEQGSYELCWACGDPINAADMESARYRFGVSCPRCFDNTTDAQKERFRERLKQVELAAARGTTHLKSSESVTAEEPGA